MASSQASVFHRIDRASFTFHSKEVVYPSGKWLGSSANSIACAACVDLHTQATHVFSIV